MVLLLSIGFLKLKRSLTGGNQREYAQNFSILILDAAAPRSPGYARMLAHGHRRHVRPPKSSGERPVLVVVQPMDVRPLDLPRMWHLQRLHGS